MLKKKRKNFFIIFLWLIDYFFLSLQHRSVNSLGKADDYGSKEGVFD